MKSKIIIAGIFGFLAVALGAFGAHGLKNILTEQLLDTYNTGILYHLIHAAVLLAIALSNKTEFTKAFNFIAAGIVLFSFSLYFYSITQIKIFAMITPVGGVSFLFGWTMIIYTGIKLQQN